MAVVDQLCHLWLFGSFSLHFQRCHGLKFHRSFKTLQLCCAGFAGQDKTLSTSHLIQCLSQHVNDKMEVQILRPSVGKKVLQIHVSEALQ